MGYDTKPVEIYLVLRFNMPKELFPAVFFDPPLNFSEGESDLDQAEDQKTWYLEWFNGGEEVEMLAPWFLPIPRVGEAITYIRCTNDNPLIVQSVTYEMLHQKVFIEACFQDGYMRYYSNLDPETLYEMLGEREFVVGVDDYFSVAEYLSWAGLPSTKGEFERMFAQK